MRRKVVRNSSEMRNENDSIVNGSLLFFDVETPNRRNDRISSIGVIAVKNGEEILRQNYLINPECGFDEFNISLTGINSVMVEDAPKFPEVWGFLRPYFLTSLCVGHNISFDLSVLDKTLTAYGLAEDFGPVNYADTLTKAKTVYSLNHYGLKPLCEYLGINLGQHHNALDDADSSEQIFWRIAQDSAWQNNDISTKWFGAERVIADKGFLTKAVDELQGILLGLSIDGSIDKEELDAIQTWMTDNRTYKNYSGFSEIYALLNSVLLDGVIDYEEYQRLLGLLRRTGEYHFSDETIAMHVLKGIIRGILADNKVSEKELENLERWMDSYEFMKNNYPFNKIYQSVQAVIEDGVVSDDESVSVINTFRKFMDPVAFAEAEDDHADLQNLKGKVCCVTGTCTSGTRAEVEQKLSDMGAVVAKSVTKKTDILIVGGEGSTNWAYGNYGGKIKKALELQNQGSSIKIIGEKEIFKE